MHLSKKKFAFLLCYEKLNKIVPWRVCSSAITPPQPTPPPTPATTYIHLMHSPASELCLGSFFPFRWLPSFLLFTVQLGSAHFLSDYVLGPNTSRKLFPQRFLYKSKEQIWISPLQFATQSSKKKKEKKICYHEPGVMVGAGHLMINKIDLHH